MSNLEIEYKTLLTKKEYQRLLEQMSHVPPVVQTNYYIDTPNFDLKAHRMSLRVRTFAEQAELTLKVPENIGNREYNIDLTMINAKEIIKTGHLPQSNIRTLIETEGIDVSKLENFGYLTTTRREATTAIGKMALDCNHYASTIDYELELEVQNAEKGQTDFDRFLEENQISFKYAKSKVARFSKTLNP
ncbi:CYTH domain-containing protein [Streptococcus porcinus]|uniref:Adenylate cyclase n=2 Tax=Streptococcus porcinus TaxID=1340 RepID=A0A4V0H834_STRPO|nr:CYTH domain-containing protein [Streptococcus porcinus]EGJ26653.1 adenylate cyclase [Streptococcus porcinus str. Jelinkova 176]SQG44274.1 adenylate cyclase [Streptococcus porcinus]VTT43877.1 adenylate cyclase [Streptococcus porcinus]VTT45257.1 adenylate cyclase [Streptococcus porcinus]